MDKPFAITLDVGSSLANNTGSWRQERPVYVHRLPPCNHACPAGENIQQWLYHAESGDYESAWRELVADNPLPAVMGRVCYHPCETACNRAQLDEAVGIHAVERFLGDEAIRAGLALTAETEPHGQARARRRRRSVRARRPPTISRRRGHEVTIREAGPMAGGMMRFGIPEYRLPREVLDAEIERILDLGVELRADAKVTNILDAMREGGYDAAFLAVGAHIGRRADIPAGEAAHILDAVTLLRGMEGQERPQLGRRVVVYGGGNTALDAARTAKRLGAQRGDRRVPAHARAHARPRLRGRGGPGGGRHDEVALHDQARRPRAGCCWRRWSSTRPAFPSPPASSRSFEADSLVLALGQDADLSLLDGVPGLQIEDGVVQVDERMMTGHAGIFAGGDMVPAERTVTVGVGHGKQAARNIDAWLAIAASACTRPSPSSRASRSSTPGTTPTRRDRRARAGRGPPPVHLRGGRARAGRVKRAVRGAPLPVVRQLLRLRQLLRRLPRQRGPEARRAPTATRSTSTTARAAASASTSARAGRSRWFRRQTETGVFYGRAPEGF